MLLTFYLGRKNYINVGFLYISSQFQHCFTSLWYGGPEVQSQWQLKKQTNNKKQHNILEIKKKKNPETKKQLKK